MEGAQSVSGPHMRARHHLLPQTPANQSIANHPSSGFLNPETPAAPDSAMAPPVPNPTPCSAVRAAPVAPQINTVAPQAHQAKAAAIIPQLSSTKAFAPLAHAVRQILLKYERVLLSPCPPPHRQTGRDAALTDVVLQTAHLN